MAGPCKRGSGGIVLPMYTNADNHMHSHKRTGCTCCQQRTSQICTLIADRTLSGVANTAQDAAEVVECYRWFIYRYCCSPPPPLSGVPTRSILSMGNYPRATTTPQPHSPRIQPHHPTHSNCKNAHCTVHTHLLRMLPLI